MSYNFFLKPPGGPCHLNREAGSGSPRGMKSPNPFLLSLEQTDSLLLAQHGGKGRTLEKGCLMSETESRMWQTDGHFSKEEMGWKYIQKLAQKCFPFHHSFP